jgi:hypothetical protein
MPDANLHAPAYFGLMLLVSRALPHGSGLVS